MGSSRETVLTCVLSKLQANFDLPMARNEPAYQAMLGDFTELLMPFDRDALEGGTLEVVLKAKSRRWPALGVVHTACQAHQKLLQERKPSEDTKPAKKRDHLPSFLNPQSSGALPMRQKQVNYWRLYAFRELQSRNALYETDEHGAYIWTPERVAQEGDQLYEKHYGRPVPEECSVKAEAARRQEEGKA